MYIFIEFRFSFALAAVSDKSGKSGLVPKHHFGGVDQRAEGMAAAAAAAAAATHHSLMANERLHQGANTITGPLSNELEMNVSSGGFVNPLNFGLNY